MISQCLAGGACVFQAVLFVHWKILILHILCSCTTHCTAVLLPAPGEDLMFTQMIEPFPHTLCKSWELIRWEPFSRGLVLLCLIINILFSCFANRVCPSLSSTDDRCLRPGSSRYLLADNSLALHPDGPWAWSCQVPAVPAGRDSHHPPG